MAVTCAAAHAQPPAPAPTPPATTPQPANAPPRGDPPDEGFIEFLGSDDVGDAAWWEFLKRAPPRGDNPPAPLPQDASK